MSGVGEKRTGAETSPEIRHRRTRLGMGLFGPGFVGAHHLDAVRRLGFVDVVAVAGSSEEAARGRAEQLGVPKAYGDFEALVADPAIDVVHVTTPNFLHAPVIRAALAHGKHVISEKPLAMTAAAARGLRDAARAAGVAGVLDLRRRVSRRVRRGGRAHQPRRWRRLDPRGVLSQALIS